MSDMSKEEIAGIEAKFKVVEKFYSIKLNPPLRYDSDKIALYVAFNAMDEYAKQQSIEFIKWVGDDYIPYNNSAVWYKFIDHEKENPYTREQLYKDFLDHQLKSKP